MHFHQRSEIRHHAELMLLFEIWTFKTFWKWRCFDFLPSSFSIDDALEGSI